YDVDALGFVRMPVEVRLHERTARDELQMVRPDVVEREADDRAPDPASLEFLRHLGVDEHHRVARAAEGEERGDTVHRRLEAVQLLVEHDGNVTHAPSR